MVTYVGYSILYCKNKIPILRGLTDEHVKALSLVLRLIQQKISVLYTIYHDLQTFKYGSISQTDPKIKQAASD